MSPSPTQPEAAVWPGSCPWPQTIPGWPCLENPQETAAAPRVRVPQREISPWPLFLRLLSHGQQVWPGLGRDGCPRTEQGNRTLSLPAAPSLPHPGQRKGWVPVAWPMARRSPTAPRPHSCPATRSSGFSIDPRASTSSNQVECQFCMSEFTLKMYNF